MDVLVESDPARTPTRPPGRLPDFIVIGAMKAGTTTLFEYLARHPRIFVCTPKEPMFFSRDESYERGERWYRSLFDEAGPDQRCGEASTCYSRAPHYADAASRMAELIPDAKLIYIMRHPVSRAYSHYKWELLDHAKVGKPITMSFEEALESSREYVDASLYMTQIELYLEHYDRDRMHFLTLDDLRSDPGEALARCQQFLAVEEVELTGDGLIVANPSDDRQLARRRFERGISRLRRTAAVRGIVNLVPRSWRRKARSLAVSALTASPLGGAVVRRHATRIGPLTSETEARLLREFEEPTRKLERFLDRSLPAWFQPTGSTLPAAEQQ